MIQAVIGVLEHEDRILLIQRARSVIFPPQWALPGGKMEPGEDRRSALIREFQEEVCVTVNPPVMHAYMRNYGIPDGCPEETILFTYMLGSQFDGVPTLSAETEGLGWFTLAEALNLSLTHGTREALMSPQIYAELYKRGQLAALYPAVTRPGEREGRSFSP